MEDEPIKTHEQDDATRFIRLNGLCLKEVAKVQKRGKIKKQEATQPS